MKEDSGGAGTKPKGSGLPEISCKWAPVRMVGPAVDPALALEFIRRTDYAFNYPSDYLCNAREFSKAFRRLVFGEIQDMDWDAQQRFRQHFEFIELEHLSSHWIASSYIGGPHGPVAPWGRVHLAQNFGKYPSVAEIERDLTAVAEAFPWLSFTLGLWDSYGETAEGEPTHCWALEAGAWRVETTYPAWPGEPDDGRAIFNLVTRSSESRECTWSIPQIDHMWGERIRAAREFALTPEGQS